jgi:hypothetical protein
MMFFTSCKTTRTVEKTVYYVPIVNFPEFPELGECEKIDGRKIATDEDYFRKLLTFRTLYFDALEKYNEKINLIEKN